MEKLLQQKERLRFTPDNLSKLEPLIRSLRDALNHPKGNTLKYTNALRDLPTIHTDVKRLDLDAVTAGSKNDIPDEDREKTIDALYAALHKLSPWRKGPFELFNIPIDTEWRSNVKWQRLEPHLSPLKNRRILDIGCSNGYYMFRMAQHNPWMVLGVDPQHTFYFQYLALQKYLHLEQVMFLPIPFDDLPMMEGYFDTVFCMGVLYHRKSPLDMLTTIREMMKKGGELIMENLIIEKDSLQIQGDESLPSGGLTTGAITSNSTFPHTTPSQADAMPLCLFPEDRYAKMRNVFFIPNVCTMTSWLKRTGFTNIRCVDISRTHPSEQRKTEWIKTESLMDFLDPSDSSKTVEGYPAPVRAIFIAEAK